MEAHLIKTPRTTPELPQDLCFFKDGQKFLHRDIWKKEMAEYKEFIATYCPSTTYKAPCICPECQKQTVEISTKELFVGYTVRDEYTDANHYHIYSIYLCKICKLGWTEFCYERTFLDTSGW